MCSGRAGSYLGSVPLLTSATGCVFVRALTAGCVERKPQFPPQPPGITARMTSNAVRYCGVISVTCCVSLFVMLAKTQ